MTVRDLKGRLTYEEAIQWGLYRERHGPFTVQARNEYGFALLAGIQTGQKDLKKFIPWYREPQVEMTPQMMLVGLQGVSAKNRGRDRSN